MSKKPDITQITNELSEGSAFFRPAAKSATSPAPSPTPQTTPYAHRKKQLPEPKLSKPSPAGQSRPLIRRTFDLFEDQLSYLTRSSLEDRLAGKEGSMNAMLRETLDEWITKRKAAK